MEKRELLRGGFLVGVGEVTIDLAREDAAVAVPQPGGDGHKVEPGHDALAGEEMAEVKEADLGEDIHAVHLR